MPSNRQRWQDVRFWIRAIAVTIGVCALTAAVGSLASNMSRQSAKRSQLGRIKRGIKALEPDIERWHKEVEELVQP